MSFGCECKVSGWSSGMKLDFYHSNQDSTPAWVNAQKIIKNHLNDIKPQGVLKKRTLTWIGQILTCPVVWGGFQGKSIFLPTLRYKCFTNLFFPKLVKWVFPAKHFPECIFPNIWWVRLGYLFSHYFLWSNVGRKIAFGKSSFLKNLFMSLWPLLVSFADKTTIITWLIYGKKRLALMN